MRAWKARPRNDPSLFQALGNMTLLDPTINGDLANKPFPEKRGIYKTSPLLITREIADLTKWGADEIEERQAAMADDALKIWTI